MHYLTKASITSQHAVVTAVDARTVNEVRRFNRFYTGRIGVLPDDYLGSSYSLGEARLLYELGHRGASTATELGRELELDLGYLSRLLQGLRRRGLVQADRATEDARRRHLSLTPKGRKSYEILDARSRQEVGALLAPLAKAHRERLVAAMHAVTSALRNEKPSVRLRRPRAGDLGWVVQAHGRLYDEEYGFDERFEAFVARIAAKLLEEFDSRWERGWIAEMDGEPVGSAFVVKAGKKEAKLRLLLIEPRARGLGLGKRLVAECIAFARRRGYRRLVLWTQSNLLAARHIYEAAGFRRVRSEPHRSFGPRVVGEYWKLELGR